jgi:hypothetical protein
VASALKSQSKLTSLLETAGRPKKSILAQDGGNEGVAGGDERIERLKGFKSKVSKFEGFNVSSFQFQVSKAVGGRPRLLMLSRKPSTVGLLMRYPAQLCVRWYSG